MYMRILVLGLMIILLLNIVNATNLQNTEIYIDKNGVLNFIEYYIVSEDFNIVLPEDYYDFNIKLNKENYELNDNVLNIKNIDKETKFELSYSTVKFSSKSENIWGISIEKGDLINIDNNVVSVYLPKNTKLLSVNEDAEVYTLNNRIIIDLRNLDEDLKIDYEFYRAKGFNLWLVFVVLLVLVFLFIFLKFKRKKSKKDVEENPIMNTLTENESKIVNLLIENKRLTQKKIRYLTGFPKSTLSRTLKHLQRKNLIEMKRVGISNVVYLKEWFKK